MSAKEKLKLKQAKKAYKQSLKNESLHNDKRHRLVKIMLDTKAPNWDTVKVSLI